MESIIKLNDAVNGFVWGPIMLALLVGTGVYLSIATGFPQFGKFGYMWKNTIGKIFQKSEAGKGEITPFQAVSTALASTVGTGNITGVTTAILVGGPGAVFWMWVSAIFGMVTKFGEVTLAVKYRERNDKGDWVGGPMYYIKNGLGKKWKWLGAVFCVFGALAALLGIGNMTQINSIVGYINRTAQAFNPAAADSEFVISLVAGILIAAFVALVVIGGVKRIGQVTEKLVPTMAVIYIVCALAVVIAHANQLGGTFAAIFTGAFTPSAVAGGVIGATVRTTITKGVARGVFSNEAGLGSAPIAHASTSERDPVKQGLYGIFEVFMDTIVICTLTALVVLTSGAADGNWNDSNLAIATMTTGFASVFGEKLGSVILTVGALLFATSTILGWSLYGTRCVEYLFGPKSRRPYQVAFCLLIVVGAVAELSVVWDIADTLNGLMAIPNLIAVLLLSPVVIKLAKEHFKGLKG
ncbi:MAG: sodium:alanine symporter family protein [Oscillospiraceae bacterium]|nr:sodium:alanine symporter family protein [Oscillospiraceae bacterium]